MLEHIAQYIVAGLTTGSIYALIALGFCVIHNATGIVNFTQVDFVSLGGLVAYSSLISLGFPMVGAFTLSVMVVTVVGAMVERLAVRPARSRPVIILIFITIGVSIFLRGVFKVIWGKNQMGMPHFSGETPITFMGATLLPQNIWIIVVTIFSVIGLSFFFNMTRTGKAMRAVSWNPRAASLMGIDVNFMVLLSFGLSGALGAIAGILIVPITTLSYDIGVMLGLKGFAAAVLGGYGNSMGAVVGGLTLGVLESVGAGTISSTYKDVIAFGVLLLVLFVKPTGILGQSDRERI